MTWELFATRRRRASAPSPCPAPGIGPSARSALALAFVAWPLALAFGLAAPLWGDVILRDPFTPVTWKFNAARALDGLVVEVGERPPVHVDLRPIAPRPRRPPEPARQRFWVSELDADAGQELVVAESEATPDATSGAIRIPLAGVTLRPGRTYAFSWGGRETNDPAGMEHRLGYAVPGAEVAARIGARFRARYFTDTSFGYVWLSVLAGLVAGGALCLAAARRSAPNL
jgi:hypothetical protein